MTTSTATIWNTNQGILPAQLHLISLGGDVANDGRFITYPDAQGTVDLLARGSVELNVGFVLSDADPGIMPTLENIADLLSPYRTDVTSADYTTATLSPDYDRIINDLPSSGHYYVGGANYLAGQDTGYRAILGQPGVDASDPSHITVLEGDSFEELTRDVTSPFYLDVGPVIEAERHAGLHVGDIDPARIIALDGDVTNGDVTAQHDFNVSPFEDLAKATEVYAGRDIVDLALLGQNNNAADVTSVVAGRDVIYPLTINGNLLSAPAAIEIGGPGNLLVMSGRNTDIGSSGGIQTFGNFLDPRLPAEGAGITIETGLGSALTTPDYAAFTTQYVDPETAAANPYAEPLQLFDADGNAIGSGDQAYAYLQTLSPTEQGILLNRIFFGLVRDSGREHTGAAGGGNAELGYGLDTIDTVGALNDAYASYQRAYAVIGTFLDSPLGTGSFLGGLSTVRTRNGGNITILSPHGGIQVGLVAPPAAFPGYSKPNDPIYALGFGIVTERGGDVDLYADGDISVNQSRVFTLEGGDMTIISRTGNIDAGKGAKTVQAIQPPSVSYDPYGDVTITPYGPASGSGIAVLRALPGVPLGNADLIAFQGVVNAGDAGIRVSGNINIAAVAVLNADNIQVGGTATGIPVAAQPNIGALTAASNTAGQAAAAATDAASQARNRPVPQDLPSIITVEVIGYGGGSGDQPAPQGNQHRRRDVQQSYDPSSSVQYVGVGPLTETQKRRLTPEEQQKLSAE